MAAEERGVEWFIENGMEPTEEQAAELALNGAATVEVDGEPANEDQSVTDQVKEAKTEEADEAEPEVKAEKAKPDDKAEEADPEDKSAKGIATQGGDGIIPYSVLRGARDQVNQLQAQNADLQRQFEELRQQIEAARTEDTATTQRAPTITTADIEITDEAVAKAFERAQGQSIQDFIEEYGEDQAKLFINPLRENLRENLALRQELTSIAEQLRSQRESEEARAIDTVQGAIDAIPTLADWQQNNRVMWRAAIGADQELKQDPDWADKSYHERFTEVVRRLGGPVDVETADTPDDKQTTDAKAAAVLAEASKKKPAVPTSLSSVPGGAPPAETLRDKAEGMTPAELQQLAESNPEMMEEMLASLT
jgi:hypothetical protein